MAINQVIASNKTLANYGGFVGYYEVLGDSGQFVTNPTQETLNVVPLAGTFSRLYVQAVSTSGGTTPTAFTFTLRKNGVDTALSVSVPDGGALTVNIADTVSVSVYDLIQWRVVGTAGGGFTILCSVQFTPADDVSSIYGIGPRGANTVVGTGAYGGALGNGVTAQYDGIATQSGSYSISPLVGAIKKLVIKSPADVNTGGGWTAFIIKNGVKQDGSGGSVDTRVSITDGGTQTNTSSFTLTSALADIFDIAYVRTGTDAPSNANSGIVCSVVFQSDSDFHYMMCGGNNNVLFETGTHNIWSGSGQLETGPVKVPLCNEVRILGIYGRVQDGPGVDSSYVFTVRKNESDTPISFTIANDDETGLDTGNESYTAGDYADISYQAINSPESHQFHWGLAAASDDSPVETEGGIYKMVPGKTDDTLYTDFDPIATEHVKIPDPFITSGLIGDE